MPELSTIYDYMRANAALLGARILEEFPALHQFDDAVSPRVEGLSRRPFAAQAIAIMGLAKRWQEARTAMVVAECGTGKTLISLGGVHVHSEGKPYTALAMVPPHLVEKWAREAFLTLPGVRVFLIDDLRNGGDENKAHGVNEVRLRQGRIVRDGFQTSLSELRLRRSSTTPRQRWLSLCGRPALFIVGRERAKLGYFWRHAYHVPRSGPYLGCVVNSDTGRPVIVDESRLTAAEFEKVKISETVESRGDKSCRPVHSALWQADSGKILRMAPIEFIGRYMPGWFDYATVRRKPGASPLLFGEFLMQLCAFVFLEDISGELPPYEEIYLSIPMDPLMMGAYRELEDRIRKALKEHRGNRSVLSTMLNTLLLYPDHPYGLGTLYGAEFDPELKRNVRFVIAETQDLPEEQLYSKERKLIEEIKKELAEGRRCQVFAVYTQKHDVTARLQRILDNEGIRTAVLRASVDTSKRETWYARQIKEGVQVVISHPKLVETGLDLLDFPTIIFYESGYSLHTLRQASRRSWRIGQRRPVRVKFLCYEGTMQTACLRLMGKKLLVALTMEGKFAGEGLQNIDEDDDMLSAMARELVERNGIGESADSVWKALSTEHQKLFPTTARSTDDESSAEALASLLTIQDNPASLIEEAIGGDSVLIFGQRPGSLSRRPRGRPVVPEQASLFG
jgi:superfamily II DNA or RNA helicase